METWPDKLILLYYKATLIKSCKSKSTHLLPFLLKSEKLGRIFFSAFLHPLCSCIWWFPRQHLFASYFIVTRHYRISIWPWEIHLWMSMIYVHGTESLPSGAEERPDISQSNNLCFHVILQGSRLSKYSMHSKAWMQLEFTFTHPGQQKCGYFLQLLLQTGNSRESTEWSFKDTAGLQTFFSLSSSVFNLVLFSFLIWQVSLWLLLGTVKYYWTW